MIYLDNSATSHYKPKTLIEAISQYLQNSGNPNRGCYKDSVDASLVVINARKAVARFFDCDNYQRVVFNSGITESLNTVILGLIHPEDEVITTMYEHNSVLRPLYKTGCKMIVTDGSIQQIKEKITPKTKAIIVSHVSNVTGEILPIRQIGQLCQETCVLFIVDSAQSAGILPLSVQKDHVDILCFTGHKSLHGLQGSGGLIVNCDVVIPPLKVGGTGIDSFNHQQPDKYPIALEAGTMNIPGILSIGKGIEDIEQQGLESITTHIDELTKYCNAQLQNLDFIEVYRTDKEYIGVISFNIKDMDAALVSTLLASEYGIANRAGAHCAPLIHDYFAQPSMVRVSFGLDNQKEDIDELIQALKEIGGNNND